MQPCFVSSIPLDDLLDDDSKSALTPGDDLSLHSVGSDEMPEVRNRKREARPLLELIMNILDTVHTSAKSEIRRAKVKSVPLYTR